MSTEHQQYSIANQSDVIREYARNHKMQIVRTYDDAGKSGLTLRKRHGLRQLLDDVEHGIADYSVILVYDVSRWGRFQDTDESAYYEYRCRKAKIQVHYCAESFPNDGSVSSALLKALKRAMAGEYSRELSVKVFAGKCRLIDLGFRQGGHAGFGLRRLVVDQNRNPKGILSRGEQKFLTTDRVILVPGPDDEIKIVREVFHIFTEEGKNTKTIANILNERGILSEQGRPWTKSMIYDMVTNPKYVGTNVTNRRSGKLNTRIVRNPPDMWVRRENAFTPIIEVGSFEKAQRITAERGHRHTSAEILAALGILLKREGRLTTTVMLESPNTPCPGVYRKHFGGLPEAYAAIGYISNRNFSKLSEARQLRKLCTQLCFALVNEFVAAGALVRRQRGVHVLRLNDEFTLQFKVARCFSSAEACKWIFRFSRRSHADMTVIARMEPGNQAVLDYYIIPRVHHFPRMTTLSLDNGFHIDAYRFAELSLLIKLARRVKLETLS